MDQFISRLDAQREILRIINSNSRNEPLFGLSKAAIERWRDANDLKMNHQVLTLLFALGEKLSCLANKSQQQITLEYQGYFTEISILTKQLEQVNT